MPETNFDQLHTYDIAVRRGVHDALWVTLNRPQELNATTLQMFDELRLVLELVESDLSIKSLVITGAGNTFCIGSDLSLLSAAFEHDDIGAFRDYLKCINATFAALENVPVPTVAAVNGRARLAVSS